MIFIALFIHRSSYFITEGNDVVKHYYPWLVIPYKLPLVHVPRSGFKTTYSMIFSGSKEKLTSLEYPGLSSCCFLKTSVIFLFSSN